MICKNCGTQIPDGAVFCFNCGSSVDNQPAQPQSPQPQPQQPAQPQYQQQAQPQYQQQAQPQYQQPAQPQYQQPARPQYQQPIYQTNVYQQQYQPVQAPARRPTATALVLSIIGLVLSLLSLILLLNVYDTITSFGRIMSSSADELISMIVFSIIFAIIGLIFGIVSTVKGATVTRIATPRPAKHTVAMIFGIISIVVSSGMLIFFISIVEAIDRYL